MWVPTTSVLIVLLIHGSRSQQFVGDSCRIPSSNSIGVCELSNRCPQAFQGGTRPTLCSFTVSGAVICCPYAQPANSNLQGGTRPSQLKCEEYSKLSINRISFAPLTLDSDAFNFEVPNCDFTVPLIVDGEKAKPDEFPHMAALGWRRDVTSDFNCGGALISDEFVMTAAHCVKKDPPQFVRLGDQNLRTDDDGADPVDYEIAQIIIHPQYQPPQTYNDIALLRLAPKVRFNKSIRPACIWQNSNINVTQAIATGWGVTEFAGDKSDDLLKVLLNIYTPRECQPSFETNSKLPQGLVDSQLCAGNRGDHKDTCQGDSGGPLQVVDPSNNCIFHLVGVTSFGKSCGVANAPGVYTRVSSYIDWIESVVWP